MGLETSLSELGKRYRLEWTGEESLEQGQARILKLSGSGDPMIEEVLIWFDRVRGIPLRIRCVSAQGDVTTTDFFDTKINAGVSPAAFELKVPEGYEMVMAEAG